MAKQLQVARSSYDMIIYTRPTIVAGDVQLYYENMGGKLFDDD